MWGMYHIRSVSHVEMFPTSPKDWHAHEFAFLHICLGWICHCRPRRDLQSKTNNKSIKKKKKSKNKTKELHAKNNNNNNNNKTLQCKTRRRSPHGKSKVGEV